MLNWSQLMLSERAEVSRGTVVDMENGKRAETSATARVVLALEGAGIEFLLGSASTGPGLRFADVTSALVERH